MTESETEMRAFATGVTHEGRSVPPKDWQLETTPGLGPADTHLEFVQVAGGALLPNHFVMHLRLPPPTAAALRVIYEVRPEGISISTIYARGMDAIQAVDMLRRVAPVEVWNRVAVLDMGLRLLMKGLSSSPDGVALLVERAHMSEDSARAFLNAFKTGDETWPTFQPSAAIPAPVDSPRWAEALGSWRGQAESGELFSTVRGTATRPKVRRNRVTKEHLAQVAAVYREAQRVGAPPTMAVADHFHTSHSTATRWVNMARNTKPPLLGAAQKGKAGEIEPDAAEE